MDSIDPAPGPQETPRRSLPVGRRILIAAALATAMMAAMVALEWYFGRRFVWDGPMFPVVFPAVAIVSFFALGLPKYIRGMAFVVLACLVVWGGRFVCHDSFVTVGQWEDIDFPGICRFKYPQAGARDKVNESTPFGPATRYRAECLTGKMNRFFGFNVLVLDDPNSDPVAFLKWFSKGPSSRVIQNTTIDGRPARIVDDSDPDGQGYNRYHRSVYVATKKAAILLAIFSDRPLENDREYHELLNSLKIDAE